ncbi:DUF6461 domain-containing protein [Streptomyces sp. NBC_00887]|uniref:DUF6461 domain-containing protein n=1 Tax=Streptomyces sp. NBC_00887 TaxID=2975859 RepID=UPI003863F931|nr:DUF6461 domain-containing protein [Streptomyces sp. NBC_00887]WSY36132.1 DUF6461 domain-containing protein [Streptomyces sp. NBC_00887]
MTDRSTAADYLWLEKQYPFLMEAYCITLIQGLGPDALLKALGADPGERMTGVRALDGLAYGQVEDGERFVAATSIGDWTLMVEHNGYVGIADTIMLPISSGRTVVSHYCNVNAGDQFYWYQDGATRLHFEPGMPNRRDGGHPDGLLTEMEEAGFDLNDMDEDNLNRHTEAAFALAEHITGVRLTPELFASAEFTCGRVPDPLR